MKNYQEIFKEEYIDTLNNNESYVKEKKQNKLKVLISLIISGALTASGSILYFYEHWQEIINNSQSILGENENAATILVATLLVIMINLFTYVLANDPGMKSRYIKDLSENFKKEMFLKDFFKLLKQKFQTTKDFENEITALICFKWSSYGFHEKLPTITNKKIFMAENQDWEYFLTDFEYSTIYGFIIHYDKISKGTEKSKGCIIENICMRFESH